jgi:ribosomal protein L37AE/L43A
MSKIEIVGNALIGVGIALGLVGAFLVIDLVRYRDKARRRVVRASAYYLNYGRLQLFLVCAGVGINALGICLWIRCAGSVGILLGALGACLPLGVLIGARSRRRRLINEIRKRNYYVCPNCRYLLTQEVGAQHCPECGQVFTDGMLRSIWEAAVSYPNRKCGAKEGGEAAISGD